MKVGAHSKWLIETLPMSMHNRCFGNANECLVCVICSSIHSFIFRLGIYNDCSHIEDVYILFYAHFTILFHFRGLELKIFSAQNT